MAYIKVQSQHWYLSGHLVNEAANAVLVESESLSTPQSGWTIDFASVETIDSSAVALMLAWVRRAKQSNVAVAMVNVPENLKTLINLYGVAPIIAV